MRPAILPTMMQLQESDVERNRIEGNKNQAKGAVKEASGKVTGNKSGELEGKLQKTVGKVQNALGKATDDARSVSRKSTKWGRSSRSHPGSGLAVSGL